MIVTTTQEIKNKNYYEMQVVMGYGAVFSANVLSDTTQITKQAVGKAMSEIIQSAIQMQADAIIDLKIEVSSVLNYVNVITYGTAIKIIQ